MITRTLSRVIRRANGTSLLSILFVTSFARSRSRADARPDAIRRQNALALAIAVAVASRIAVSTRLVSPRRPQVSIHSLVAGTDPSGMGSVHGSSLSLISGDSTPDSSSGSGAA